MVTTTTGFVITPYVGVISYPYRFQVNKDEIAKLIFAPLQALKEQFHCDKSIEGSEKGGRADFTFYYQDHVIWGATARILCHFMELIRDL
jgi:hypothetical protein